MKTASIGIEDKIDYLSSVLDRDIEHIQASLLRLNELRGFVIKRDDVALTRLLGDIKADLDSYAANESERFSIQKEMAGALGCEPEQVTLTRLEGILPKEKTIQLKERKEKLRSLTRELKKEYTSTAILLSDCMRFNKLLLRSIFKIGKVEAVEYSADGRAKQQAETAFVNVQL
jgi:hypothetical protein